MSLTTHSPRLIAALACAIALAGGGLAWAIVQLAQANGAEPGPPAASVSYSENHNEQRTADQPPAVAHTPGETPVALKEELAPKTRTKTKTKLLKEARKVKLPPGWFSDYDQALAQAKMSGQPLLVLFH